MLFLAGLALLIAAAALLKAREGAVRARQALATIDELLTLVEQLADGRETAQAGAPEPLAGAAPAPSPQPRKQGAAGEDSPGYRDGREGITPELRAVIPDLYGQGTPLTEIARRSGLSRSEVKMLIAISERSRRGAM